MERSINEGRSMAKLCKASSMNSACMEVSFMHLSSMIIGLAIWCNIVINCAPMSIARTHANLLREDALLQSDVVVYNSCISACGKGQQWQSAMILAMLYNRSH